jgi:hypothetical protein
MQFNGRAVGDGGGSAPGLPGWLEPLTEYGGRFLLFLVAAVLLLSLKKNLGRLGADGCPTTGRGAAAGGQEGIHLGAPGAGVDRMAEDVKDYAAENPEKVAEVIQSWITESERTSA